MLGKDGPEFVSFGISEAASDFLPAAAALTASRRWAIPISNETGHQLEEVLSWRKRNPRNLPSRTC